MYKTKFYIALNTFLFLGRTLEEVVTTDFYSGGWGSKLGLEHQLN